MSSNSINISIRESGAVRGVFVVDIKNNLDFYSIDAIKEQINSMILSNKVKIVLNMSEVKHINSASIGVLIGKLKELKKYDGALKMYGLNQNIKRIFDLIGASKIFEIYDNEQSAVSNF